MLKKRIFKTKPFARWVRKNGLSDFGLLDAIQEIEKGLIDADLGCNVYKKRVRLQGIGKRGGARVIVATKLLKRWFFIFGFSKNDKSNISNDELLYFQETAKRLLNLSDHEIDISMRADKLEELKIDEK